MSRHLKAILDGEANNPAYSQEVEAGVRAKLTEVGMPPEALASVDCRESLCQLVILHEAGGVVRDELDTVIGHGPLSNGAYDYLDDDGNTVIYAGTQTHPLHAPSARTLPPSEEYTPP